MLPAALRKLKLRPRNRVLQVLIILGLVYVLWLAVLYFVQDRFLFQSPWNDRARPVEISGATALHREITGAPRPAHDPNDPILRDHPPIETPETKQVEPKRVEALFIPAEGADEYEKAPLVIFFHGNAEVVDDLQWIVDHYHAMGLSVLLPEYRGYGRSEGKPSQAAIREDMIAFYEMAARLPGVDRKRIVFHGRSLGGAVASDLAAVQGPKPEIKRCAAAAMILQTTPSSVSSYAWRLGAPPLLVNNPYRTDDVIGGLKMPILLIAGKGDTIVPMWHAKRLHDRAPGSKLVEFEAGHNDLPGRGEEEAYWGAIRRFLVDAKVLDPEVATTRPGNP